ncbi:MAG: hypothetical protein IIW48_01330 [Clostridia bacterium]|nr:hypothetical protein [Clostridia bacterium]
MAALILEVIGFSATVICVMTAVYMLCVGAVSPGASGTAVVVLRCGNADECVRLLYSAHLRAQLFAGFAAAEVVAVDAGMTDEQRRRCEELCRSYSSIKIISHDELSTFFLKDEV